VFEGDAIYNALRRKSITGSRVVIHVDGVAASAAAFIAMAGDEINIAENAFLMLHEAWTYAMGNKQEIQKTIDLLAKIDEVQAKIFASRSGQDVAKVTEWLVAETWFGAQEAIDAKLADKIGTDLKTATVTDSTARMSARWGKTPKQLAASIAKHAAQAKKDAAKSPTPRLAALQTKIHG
jgi:ATP-dependent Clp protease protease subunit